MKRETGNNFKTIKNKLVKIIKPCTKKNNKFVTNHTKNPVHPSKTS